jgi:hypothetical protein
VNVQIGRAGVFLAASRLEHLGTQVVVCDQQGFDILALCPAPVRIEVKATARGPVSSNRLEFNTGKGGDKTKVSEKHCDVVALADLMTCRCLFFPVKNITRKNFKVAQSQFDAEREMESWNNCMRSYT